MQTNPPNPNTGNAGLDVWAARINRQVRTNMTQPGLFGVTRTLRGTIVQSFARRARSPITAPFMGRTTTAWQIFQWTPAAPADGEPATYWRNVRVHRGYVNRKTTTAAKFVHELDPNLPTGSNAGSDYDILVPENTTAYKIWGEAQFTFQPVTIESMGGIRIDALNIEHGTDWWAEHPAMFASAGEFRFEIGTVTTGDDEDTPTSLTIDQIADGNINLFPFDILFVTLDQTGGSAGDKDTPCSFTYEATDLGGRILGDGLEPLNSRARILNAPTTAATQGTVFIDGDGLLQLWDCDETVAQYSCT